MSSSKPQTSESVKKRARYISVACNECKRRKIKCNGEKPCVRCGNQSLECVYTSNEFQDSDEHRRMVQQIDSLETQVNGLHSLVQQLRIEMAALTGREAAVAQEPLQAQVQAQAPADVQSLSQSQLQSQGQKPLQHNPLHGDHGEHGDQFIVGGAGGGGAAEAMDLSSEVPVDYSLLSSIDRSAVLDPLVWLCQEQVDHLMDTYLNRIYPLFPLADRIDVMRRIDELAQARASAKPNGNQCRAHDPIYDDDQAVVLKMVLAVATKSQHDVPATAGVALFENVQGIYLRKGQFLQASGPDGGKGLDVTILNGGRKAGATSIRLRMLQALWYMQNEQDDQALFTITEAMHANGPTTDNPAATAAATGPVSREAVQVSQTLYTLYWIMSVLLKRPPRMNHALDRPPSTDIENDGSKDDDGTVRDTLFEYAKLCALSCVAYETGSPTVLVFDSGKRWTMGMAIDHVYRWQSLSSVGLRSMSILRFETMAAKKPRDQIALSCVSLLGNHLRLTICAYRCIQARERMQPSPDKNHDMVRFASDSISVLFNVHRTSNIWAAQPQLYSSFLIHASTWILMGTVEYNAPLDAETAASVRNALTLLKLYCSGSPKAAYVVDRLQAIDLDSFRNGSELATALT